jgi:hypothetical protein
MANFIHNEARVAICRDILQRMTGNSLRDRIRNEDLRKLLEIEAAINYIKRQQIKWFGHVIRQKELNITQRVINKKYENTRPIGRPRKRWIGGILRLRETLQLKGPTEELMTTI